jgi:hypothetical protein
MTVFIPPRPHLQPLDVAPDHDISHARNGTTAARVRFQNTVTKPGVSDEPYSIQPAS